MTRFRLNCLSMVRGPRYRRTVRIAQSGNGDVVWEGASRPQRTLSMPCFQHDARSLVSR